MGEPAVIEQSAAADRRETFSDDTLIKQIAGGNKLAMRALFARHQLRVYRFALRIVRDSALAEDVVSEVFIDAWQHAGEIRRRKKNKEGADER